MKKITIIILAAIAALTGCNRVLIESAGNGFLSCNLSAEGEYVDVLVKSANDDKSSFKVDVVNTAGVNVKHYDRYSDMPSLIELPSGHYTLKVQSPNALPAAFDQPVYGAEKSFEVKVGETCYEKVVCTLQNVMVTLDPSQSFLDELESYTISIANGMETENILYWTNVPSEIEGQYLTKDITRSGYFSPAPLTIRIDGKRGSDGSTAYVERTYHNVNPKDHFTISIDAKVAGSAGFEIEVSTEVNQKNEDVFIPSFDENPVPDDDEEETPGDTGNTGGDDSGSGDDTTGDGGTTGGNADDMELIWPSNPTLAQTDITGEMDVELTLKVPGRIKGFVIDLTSDTQSFMSLCSQMTSNPQEEGSIESVRIDLINDPTAVTLMAGAGLTTGENLYNKDEVSFSLSSLVPLIPTAGQAQPDSYHTFALTVTDMDGDSKTWTLVFYNPGE